jgi:hypothetical protein
MRFDLQRQSFASKALATQCEFLDRFLAANEFSRHFKTRLGKRKSKPRRVSQR